MDTHDSRSVPQLLSDAMHELSLLMRKEVELVRTEISEKTTQIKKGLGLLAAGIACLLAALIIVLQAAVVALIDMGVDAKWSALIVGTVVAVIGVVFLKSGGEAAQPSNLTPTATLRQVKQDTKIIKERVT